MSGRASDHVGAGPEKTFRILGRVEHFHDLPVQMENIYIEHEQSNGPFGAKGVGEVATFCVGPAIANAIDDAAGVRLMEMPLNAEAVFRALRAKQGKPLEDA